MKLVGLAPARGGSKGIPRKSIAACAGRPLLAYTAEAALGARGLAKVILSTDDEEIARVGRECGLEVPFLRPASLAADDTPMLAVMRHALDWAQAALGGVDGLVLLQPTSPLRTSRHIDEACELFDSRQADTVVSVVEVPHQFNPVSALNMSATKEVTPFLDGGPVVTRRQDKPRVFARNGPAVVVVRAATLGSDRLYGEKTLGYEMDRRSSLDVDDPFDLELAAFLLERARSGAAAP